MLFTNCQLYIDGEIKPNMWLAINCRQIEGFGEMTDCYPAAGADVYNLQGRHVISAGFIDQHVHGAVGHDFMDGSVQATTAILRNLATEGVTSVLATTTTMARPRLLHALENLASFQTIAGPQILGIHLEGPYIAHEACGAHAQQYIERPSLTSFKSLQTAAQNKIKMVTLAPECDRDHRLIKYLLQRGIVASIGHSMASAQQTRRAIKSGCNCITHCFNAMSGIHHRDVGAAGVALLTAGVKTEIIADGVHLSSDAINLFDSMKRSEDIILISDAMRAKGLSRGDYHLAGQSVHYDGQAVRDAQGKLAGSVLSCDQALRNYMAMTNQSLSACLAMLTETPAKLHGVFDKKGSIAVGKDADLVVLDNRLQVVMTLCRGEVVYAVESGSFTVPQQSTTKLFY